MKRPILNNSKLRVLLLSLLCVLSVSVFTSCTDGDEEPEISINYYLLVKPRSPIYTRGGLPPDSKSHMIGLLTLQMREKIEEVYPVKDLQGNDAAVMMACDDVYDTYLQSGLRANVECIATLYRARMSGIIVKKSTPLKSYYF